MTPTLPFDDLPERLNGRRGQCREATETGGFRLLTEEIGGFHLLTEETGGFRPATEGAKSHANGLSSRPLA